ncbi:serine/threonine-protein kinase ATR-like [Tachypleus tridentatus]|uniref:serine/threonine-protein kinase ATR-like n=1 Tax=Tachypleus tridentatus TaxID=6853 RepID=UPI003FD30B2F
MGFHGRAATCKCKVTMSNAKHWLEWCKVTTIGFWISRNTFSGSTLRYMLPPLATKASPEASMLLKVLAKQMRMQKQELLMNHFKYIFSYLVCHCSKEEMEKALTYVQAKFLQSRLLGFLAFFDSQLLNANFPLEEKKLALGSLNSIMELMGPKHITAVRMKVMATLKIAIHFTEEDFPQICTQAWNTFVHKLEMKRLSENQKSSFFYLSVEDENFAYDLVQELVRSFLAAEDTRIQDCASYALQETLQIYTCQSGELSQIVRPSGSLWNRFSEEVQEILVPLQHSRYIMSSNKRTSFPCPIYGSKLGSTFIDWACNWASCLLRRNCTFSLMNQMEWQEKQHLAKKTSHFMI